MTRTWQSSKFVQDLQLYAGTDNVDVISDIDWKEKHCSAEGSLPSGSLGTDGDLRDSLRQHRAPYGTQQLLAEGDV